MDQIQIQFSGFNEGIRLFHLDLSREAFLHIAVIKWEPSIGLHADLMKLFGQEF